MELQEAIRQETQIRKQQKNTKYSDAEVKQVVEGAITCSPEDALANALTALAMIAYNWMIDKRWEK